MMKLDDSKILENTGNILTFSALFQTYAALSFCKPATAKRQHDSSHIAANPEIYRIYVGCFLALLAEKIQPSHPPIPQSSYR